jgi:hypothetical protein
MDRIKVERAIIGLTEWQKHVQTNSDIDRDISTAIEALKAQLSQEGATKGATSDLISRQEAIDRAVSIPMFGRDVKMVAVSEIKTLPPAQPELNLENLVRMIEFGITATNSRDAYSLGMRNGMRWCKSLIDGVEPKYEYGATRVDDGTDSAELPPAQPESEHTMEEFMYGQDLGSPEDGSL